MRILNERIGSTLTFTVNPNTPNSPEYTTVPSAEWEISEDGITATKELTLGESWSNIHFIYHSPEPKAVATAHIFSVIARIPTRVKVDLHELRIPTITSSEEFMRRVGAHLAGFPDREFEDWDDATARINVILLS